jgi:hypothetical protein
MLIARPFAFALALAIALPAAGCSSPSTDKASSDKSADKESKGSADKDTKPASKSSSTAAASGDTKPAKAAAPSPDEKVDLAAILGTKKDGWSPKVISGLKRGMKPEEAAKVFPGADKVSEFGFVEIPIEGHPGLEEIRLYFKKNDGVPNELQSVKLGFHPAYKTDAFWDELSKACIERYGKADDKELEKRLITWVGPKSGMAQLTKGLTDNHGFTLDITLQR